jgi:hypothetical protein
MHNDGLDGVVCSEENHDGIEVRVFLHGLLSGCKPAVQPRTGRRPGLGC